MSLCALCNMWHDDDDDQTQIQTGFLCFMKNGQAFEKKKNGS